MYFAVESRVEKMLLTLPFSHLRSVPGPAATAKHIFMYITNGYGFAFFNYKLFSYFLYNTLTVPAWFPVAAAPASSLNAKPDSKQCQRRDFCFLFFLFYLFF